MSTFLLEPRGPQKDYYLFLNLSLEEYQAFKEMLETRNIRIRDKQGLPYGSLKPHYRLFCYVPSHYGSLEQMKAIIAAALGGAGAPVPPTTMLLVEWETKLDQIVRRLRRGTNVAADAPSDRLAIAEAIRNGKFGEALRELELHERAGAPLGELARQYLWVYSEQGAWAAVADVFERAREHLAGSVLAHMRVGQAYLELALAEPRRSERRSHLLSASHSCIQYALSLDDTRHRPQVEAKLQILLAQVEEAEGAKETACSLRLRAQALLERHNLEGSRQNGREIARLLGGIPSNNRPHLAPELAVWLGQLPNGGLDLVAAAGLPLECLRDAPEEVLITGPDWDAQLERWQSELESSPAEVGVQASNALELTDLPSSSRLALRLLKLEADERVVGLSQETCSETLALWQESHDACSVEQRRGLLWRLTRCAELRRDNETVLKFGQMLLGLPEETASLRSAQVLAKLGLASAETGKLDDAVRYLKWAQERNWGGKPVAAALASVHRKRGDTDAELAALLRLFEDDPVDSDSLERLLEIYMEREDWVNSLRACDQFLSGLQTPVAARQHRQVFSYKKDCLDALISKGLPGFDEAYAEAVEALMEIDLEAGDYAAALNLFQQERNRLAQVGWLVRVASSLELGDAACKAAAATQYGNLILAEIERVPRHDHAHLVELLQRVWILDEAAYDELAALLRDRQDRVNADPHLCSESKAQKPTAPTLDLSGNRVVIVGAYSDVRQRAADELRRRYRLDELVEIPPSWERNLDQDDIRQLLQGADLIVEVPRCIKHRTTVAIGNILQTHPIMRVYAQGKGQTSIIRAVEGYFQSNLPAGA